MPRLKSIPLLSQASHGLVVTLHTTVDAEVRTSVVCLKTSVADSTRFDMIAITSSKHVPWPITAPATMLPIIIADTSCQ